MSSSRERSSEEKKAMFANMNHVDLGISSTQIGIPNQIPTFNHQDENEIHNFAESNFEKFEKGEMEVVKDKNLTQSQKVSEIEKIEKEEVAVEELTKTVRVVQSPNSSGHEKFKVLDNFLKDKRYSKTLPKSIRDKLEDQRELLEMKGFGKKTSTDPHKEDSEVLIDGHEIDVEVKISNG